jgi:hypothetical protein
MSSSDGIGGVGGVAAGALSGIGSDLSVSVSFSIASELLDAGRNEQLSEEETIAIVLGFTIVFSAVQARLASDIQKRRERRVEKARTQVRATMQKLRTDAIRLAHLRVDEDDKQSALLQAFEDAAVEAEVQRQARVRDLLDFAHLLVTILQRIGVAISVQLLAASVKTQQPSRVVRTISLCGLATFFVFVESLSQHTG